MNTSNQIITMMAGVIFLILVTVFILHFGFSTARFNEWCSSNGGEIRELENITCAIEYPDCWRLCDFECGVVSYYDEWEIPECS
jgi:hypothetical protein